MSLAVEVQVEFADDVIKGEEVADEEDGSEDWGALRGPLHDWGEGGCVTREGDELLPVGEAIECSALNTLLAQPLKEDGVVHSVKGCGKIEE